MIIQAGELGVGAGGDDGQDTARGGEIPGREVAEQPDGDVLTRLLSRVLEHHSAQPYGRLP